MENSLVTAVQGASRLIDPVLTLSLPRDCNAPSELGSAAPSVASITSLCFLSTSPDRIVETSSSSSSSSSAAAAAAAEAAADSDSDSSDDEDLPFRCRSLVQGESARAGQVRQSACRLGSTMDLNGRYIASAHGDGSSFLWDLGQQKVVQPFAANRGPALLLRRLHGSNESHVLYHTRDDLGTVTIHDTARPDIPEVTRLETYSRTFCCACPSTNNPHMVALPGDDDTVAIVRDLRMSGESQPVARLYGATDPPKHGMVQSLAYCTDASGQDILACGMESGHVFFHDLTMSSTLSSRGSCSVALCRDPILSLDMVPSSHHHDTVIAIAGMAANRSDLLDLAPEDRGTVAFIKTVRLYNDTLEATVRVRRNTCTIDDSVTATGKPGAAICRFRPDGRMFAVGGWDKRLRIFDSKGSVNPLAILRGHAESVYAMDWSLDSSVSGIMATGAPDGRINVWRCFSKTQAESSLLTS